MSTSRMAVITFLDGSDNSIDNTLPGGGYRPVDPGYGQGGHPHPGHGLPGGGHITTLPVFPFDPTLPDQGLPGDQPAPGNDLPRPGKKYVVKWLACHGLILVPDNSLPAPEIDNTLPSTPAPKKY